MTNKPFSNAVFTLLPPDNIPDPKFDTLPEDDGEDDDFGGITYQKAVDGSYDKSYFTDETSGGFRFPNYNKTWNGLVQVRDVTPYKDRYFAYLRYEDRASFSIDKFESKFSYPVWEVQDFNDFLHQLPPTCFHKGINRTEVLDLFDEFEDFINGELKADHYFEIGLANTNAFKVGLLEKADKSKMKPKDLWENININKLDEVCKANGVEPAKRPDTTIKRLIERNVAFPFDGVKPSQLLKDTYFSFVDLYIQEIRQHADHFHPLFFKGLWEQVKRECCNEDVKKEVAKIIANPYWKNRLYKVDKPVEKEDE